VDQLAAGSLLTLRVTHVDQMIEDLWYVYEEATQIYLGLRIVTKKIRLKFRSTTE
jgi:hypothetical protein